MEYDIKHKVFELIRRFEVEINNNEWDKIYKATNFSGWTEYAGLFTETLLAAGINPLDNLTYIPSFYLAGSNVEELIIPEHIHQIQGLALSRAYNLTYVFIPKSVTIIGIKAFDLANVGSNRGLFIEYPGTVADWRNISIHPQVSFPKVYYIKTSEGLIR